MSKPLEERMSQAMLQSVKESGWNDKTFAVVCAKIAREEVDKVRAVLRELAMRGNFAFPECEQDMQWFDAGMKDAEQRSDFMHRLFAELGLGNLQTPLKTGES